MIRNTDSMIKAMNVQKAKERMKSWQDALSGAINAGNHDMSNLFRGFIQDSAKEVDDAMDALKNPSM